MRLGGLLIWAGALNVALASSETGNLDLEKVFAGALRTSGRRVRRVYFISAVGKP